MNVISNLIMIRDDLRRSIEFLSDKDDSANKVMKTEALKDLENLTKQIDYLHEYLKEIADYSENLLSNIEPGSMPRKLLYWHEIKAKVDKND